MVIVYTYLLKHHTSSNQEDAWLVPNSILVHTVKFFFNQSCNLYSISKTVYSVNLFPAPLNTHVCVCLWISPEFLQSSQPSEAHPRGREDPAENQPADCRVSCTPASTWCVSVLHWLYSWHLFWTRKTRQSSRGGKNIQVGYLCRCPRSDTIQQVMVFNGLSWFVCLFQVRDHGADGRVTGDLVWAALPLGPEWVQYRG